MNREIDKLINPPWLKSLRRIQKHTSLATSALQGSEAMLSIRKLNEPSKLASLALSQSELIKYAKLAAERSRLASLAFQDSEAMQSIRDLTASSRFSVEAFQESEAMKSLKATAESMRLSSIALHQSGAVRALQNYAKTSQLASIAISQSEAFNKICQLNSLASFKALASLQNSPFTNLSSVDFALEIDTEQVVDKSLLEIDSKISDEVSSATDFDALSEKTKKILIYLYYYYFLPLLLSCLSTYIMSNAFEAKKKLEPLSRPADVKAFVRSSRIGIDRTALKGYRVTIVDTLNFRDGPGMKSKVITTLSIGTLVEVVDKSHRSWLLVEVEINGEIEQGWISRRYTTYFK